MTRFENRATVTIEGMARNQVYTFARWEKYGKRRIYIDEAKWGKIGYIDMDTKEYVGNTHPAYMEAIEQFRAEYEF